MSIKLVICLLVIFGFNGAACQQKGSLNDLEKFKSQSNEAKKMYLNGEFQKAEQQYNSAQETANKMNWTDGIVMTKRAIAEIYTSKNKKQYDRAETILNEAKEICISSKDCLGGQLSSVYSELMFIYLFEMKDIGKASRIVDETISSRQKLSESETEGFKSILNGYVSNMRTAGFVKEAAELENRIKYMK